VVLKRKKAHRRAKRRAERKRRKALAAAGLSEDTRNDDAQLQEKLEDLQRQHRAKRKGETGVVSSPSAKSKVRSWRAGLMRRRKGKGDEGDENVVVIKEEGGVEGPVDIIVDGGRGSEDTGDTSATATSFERTAGTNTTPSVEDIAAQPSDITPTTLIPPAPGTTTYFPPAYRPASVRSLGRAGPSEPSSSTSQPTIPNSSALPVTEKIHAPGYYPAPATAEGEAALAVASRSEGKSRLVPLDSPSMEEDGETQERGHAATDDKRVLERMRMAASAPPIESGEPIQAGEGEDGPSAPGVEVDGDGFERFTNTDIQEGSSTANMPVERHITHHPALPAPPQQNLRRSYSVEREVHEQLDELNLLPSAPPLASPLVPTSTPLAHSDGVLPSAPPLMDEEEEEEVVGPSAPPLIAEDEERDEEEEILQEGNEPEETIAEEVVVAEAPRRPSEAPTLFLPKYEP
jgi:hypothetical protein